MEMNKKEIDALFEKLENPTKQVICPRCGKILIVETVGNSQAVICPTDECIHLTLRGI